MFGLKDRLFHLRICATLPEKPAEWDTTNVSRDRLPDGGSAYGFFTTTAANWNSKAPTPGAVNVGVVTDTIFSIASPLAGAVFNVPYTNSFTATGGATPYPWSITAGSVAVPMLTTNSVLSGTPTKTGTFSFTTQVADGASATATKIFTVEIAHNAPTLSVEGYPQERSNSSFRAILEQAIVSSINLLDWTTVFTTNSVATPFNWTASGANSTAAFYCAILNQ